MGLPTCPVSPGNACEGLPHGGFLNACRRHWSIRLVERRVRVLEVWAQLARALQVVSLST